MRALVIGGNGFIGSHLVDRLVKERVEVVVLDFYERRYDPMPPNVRFIKGDLSKLFLVREALINIDVVYHLAWATIHEVSNQDPAADVTTNLIPSIQLLEACRQAEISRFVFTSSGGTVYGLANELPIPETFLPSPITGYGITKLAMEKYLHMFRHLYGLDYVVLRPSVPYGPRQNPLGRQGAVAVFLYRAAHDLPITIWGDGSVTRDYFYVSDMVDALVASAQAPLRQERVFNIGGTEAVSLNRLVEYVADTVGRKVVVKYKPSRGFDAPHISLNTDLARRDLNWHHRVTLEEGLAHTWHWISKTLD